MNRADLTGAKLRNSIVRKADFSGAVLRNADLSGANFNGSTLKDVDLRGANLANCDLSGTQLNRAVVEGAFLDGVVLTDANVHGVDLKNAIYNSLDTSVTISVDDSAETQALIGEMIVAHESWVTSSGLEGQRADFSNADLSGLDFSGRNLRGALFADSRLRSAKFHRAIVDLGDFSRCDLTGASFGAASLRGANFTSATLRRTDFSKCRPRDRDRGAGRRQDARMAAALQRLQARGNQFQGREGDPHHRDQCGHEEDHRRRRIPEVAGRRRDGVAQRRHFRQSRYVSLVIASCLGTRTHELAAMRHSLARSNSWMVGAEPMHDHDERGRRSESAT